MKFIDNVVDFVRDRFEGRSLEINVGGIADGLPARPGVMMMVGAVAAGVTFASTVGTAMAEGIDRVAPQTYSGAVSGPGAQVAQGVDDPTSIYAQPREVGGYTPGGSEQVVAGNGSGAFIGEDGRLMMRAPSNGSGAYVSDDGKLMMRPSGNGGGAYVNDDGQMMIRPSGNGGGTSISDDGRMMVQPNYDAGSSAVAVKMQGRSGSVEVGNVHTSGNAVTVIGSRSFYGDNAPTRSHSVDTAVQAQQNLSSGMNNVQIFVR